MNVIKICLGVLLSFLVVVLTLNQIKIYRGPVQLMNITATGKATAVPDLATATLGVTSQGASPDDVKASNTQKMNAVIAYLKQAGINDKDIQTTGFYTSPRYQYQSGKSSIAGYQADQTVTVIFRKVNDSKTQLETCLNNVTQYGVNNIQGVSFSFSSNAALKEVAIKQAIENAKQQAVILTHEAGLNLGKLVNIIPGDGGAELTPMAYNMAAKMANGPVNTIALGSQDVSASVTLVYALGG